MTDRLIELKIVNPLLLRWGIPEYESAQAGAVDIRACTDESIFIEPGAAPILIPTGFAVHIADANLAALILPRSGLGHKKGLILGNTVGLVDADFMGQVMISAWNRNPGGSDAIEIAPGSRIAQMMFVPILRPNFSLVAEFSVPSERGVAGFGSTGT